MSQPPYDPYSQGQHQGYYVPPPVPVAKSLAPISGLSTVFMVLGILLLARSDREWMLPMGMAFTIIGGVGFMLALAVVYLKG